MAPFKAPARLPEIVKAAFDKARASGDLIYFPSQVAVLNVNSIPFQLRYSPALANKPKAPKPSGATQTKPYDPFENPPAALVIPTTLGGGEGQQDGDSSEEASSHFLVLNKFAVVPEHFILATRAFRPQTHLLEADDLAAAWACIEAYRGEGEGEGEGEEEEGGLYVFYNSGEHSGASQPHRHLQLVPIARMRDGLDEAEQAEQAEEQQLHWSVLADRLVADDDADADADADAGGQRECLLPFTVFASRLRPGMDGPALRRVYLDLYRRACAAAAVGLAAEGEAQQQQEEEEGEEEKEEEEEEEEDEEGEARISYNLAMTRGAMVLCPRTAEGASIAATDDAEGGKLGKVALNGTLLAGTALVKSQAEWDALRQDPRRLLAVLGKIGVPLPSPPSPPSSPGRRTLN